MNCHLVVRKTNLSRLSDFKRAENEKEISRNSNLAVLNRKQVKPQLIINNIYCKEFLVEVNLKNVFKIIS